MWVAIVAKPTAHLDLLCSETRMTSVELLLASFAGRAGSATRTPRTRGCLANAGHSAHSAAQQGVQRRYPLRHPQNPHAEGGNSQSESWRIHFC